MKSIRGKLPGDGTRSN